MSYLLTSFKGIRLCLYPEIELWRRKVVESDMENSEDPCLAAELISRACLRERIGKRSLQPLILHADNGNAPALGF